MCEASGVALVVVPFNVPRKKLVTFLKERLDELGVEYGRASEGNSATHEGAVYVSALPQGIDKEVYSNAHAPQASWHQDHNWALENCRIHM